MKLKIDLLLILGFLAGAHLLVAQQVMTNAQGDKIVRFDDGSWRYYEVADSVLEQNTKVKVIPDQISTEDSKSTEKLKPSTSGNEEIQIEREKEKTNRKTAPTSINKSWKAPDLLENPPPYTCPVAFSGVDPFTNKNRTDLEKEVLLTYTDPEVKSYLLGRSYMTMEAFMTEYIGSLRYLSIKITIASKTARAEYGYVKSGSLLTIKLLNGETVSLFTTSSDIGIIDDTKNQTIFKISFPLSKENQKLLQNSLADKLRLTWSTGYEEYDIFNVDFFSNQLNCLNKI